jgi:hypothetical protein
MLAALLAAAIAASASAADGSGGARPWMDVSAPPAARAKTLLAHMTLEEKLVMRGAYHGLLWLTMAYYGMGCIRWCVQQGTR